MLTWDRDRNGYVSNGFRIELLEPCRWALFENEAADIEPIPLAETETLTQCKRKAELVDRDRRVARVRRRMWAELAVALPAFALVPMVGPWGPAVFLVLLVIATRSIGFLAGTYLAQSHLVVGHLKEQGGRIAEDRLSLWPTRHLTRYRHGL